MIKNLKLGQTVIFAATVKKDWREKKVKNPKTGNMVKIKSLPPKLQEKYRPKNIKKAKEDKLIPKKQKEVPVKKKKPVKVKKKVVKKVQELAPFAKVPKNIKVNKKKAVKKEKLKKDLEIEDEDYIPYKKFSREERKIFDEAFRNNKKLDEKTVKKRIAKKQNKEKKFKDATKKPEKLIKKFEDGVKDLNLPVKVMTSPALIAESYDLVDELNKIRDVTPIDKEAESKVREKAAKFANELANDTDTENDTENESDNIDSLGDDEEDDKRNERDRPKKYDKDLLKYDEDSDDWQDGGFFSKFLGTIVREHFDKNFDLEKEIEKGINFNELKKIKNI